MVTGLWLMIPCTAPSSNLSASTDITDPEVGTNLPNIISLITLTRSSETNTYLLITGKSCKRGLGTKMENIVLREQRA